MPLLFAISIAAASLIQAPNGEPAHEPQLAVSGSTVALVYGAGHSIYFSRSADGGKTFGSPVEVAEGSVIPLSRHRGPRIVSAGSDIVITAVVGRTAATGAHAHGLPSDGDLTAWRSTNGGKSWSQGILINDRPGAATEGLHSLAATSNGRLFAAWLDKRNGKTELYGALSNDSGKTWAKNTLIYASPDGTICECCHPSAAFDPDGSVLVMFRNWLGGCRDMYLTRSADGNQFKAPIKLGNGDWKLNACPMDGGGIAATSHGIVTVWRREHSLFLARPGQPETEIGTGTDVAVAAGPHGVYAIWSTPESIEILIPGEKIPQATGVKGAYPAIAALEGHVIAAWENDGKIVVQRVSDEKR